MTDAKLMEHVQNDELNYLGELFERYADRLYRYFLKGTSDPSRSEDLTQEVFEKVIRYRHTYRGESVFEGWLFRIARNTLIEMHRVTKRNRSESLEGIEILEQSKSDELDELATRKKKLLKAISTLKQEHQEIIQLTRFENLNYQEVAEFIGISETGVKARVFRAMKNLKKAYFEIS